jgi:hypothetical protein
MLLHEQTNPGIEEMLVLGKHRYYDWSLAVRLKRVIVSYYGRA